MLVLNGGMHRAPGPAGQDDVWCAGCGHGPWRGNAESQCPNCGRRRAQTWQPLMIWCKHCGRGPWADAVDEVCPLCRRPDWMTEDAPADGTADLTPDLADASSSPSPCDGEGGKADGGSISRPSWRSYEMLPAVSVWQPWAELIARGIKRFETRSWWLPQDRVCLREHLAIHAAQKPWSQVIRGFGPGALAEFEAACRGVGFEPNDRPRGCVVAVVQLLGQVRTESTVPPGQEALWGDWRPGRWAWELELVERLEPPVPAKGGQKIWWWATHGTRAGRSCHETAGA